MIFSYREVSCSVPGYAMWHMSQANNDRNRLISCFGFTLSVFIPPMLHPYFPLPLKSKINTTERLFYLNPESSVFRLCIDVIVAKRLT